MKDPQQPNDSEQLMRQILIAAYQSPLPLKFEDIPFENVAMAKRVSAIIQDEIRKARLDELKNGVLPTLLGGGELESINRIWTRTEELEAQLNQPNTNKAVDNE